ncbi:S1 family peptidase [Porphyrobacter sp. LM 6]|uniref:S1 family peptidase n=1 Tax=Porphyrobacter sp. LM 6 TaxID=1896196 RepID=UPI000846F43F|nr:serine protease [Porphyrobacter sp. LM 6]AOL95323.1 Trypsin-like peptidase domain-containing protein [Porphyrobacter sp. LM 6]
MLRRLIALVLIVLALPSAPAAADPGDVEAAARGVVRVVIIGEDGGDPAPISHGTGFAVSPTRIVTNAHVVTEALQDDTLRIGIVPSEGDGGAFARVIAVSPRNDLALLEIARGSLRLPPLALASGVSGNLGEVSAVGYPMNVDLAQGLGINDIFRAQPPVKSRGFLSGERPSRQFDTILHTAPIARGNSGGPLLDPCGRVIGVNSFSADSASGDAEFYFAVSLRELLPFLRSNGVEPVTNALPCRSIDELNAEERQRLEAEQSAARQRMAERAESLREVRETARLKAQMDVLGERENAMALALIALLGAVGGAYAAAVWRGDRQRRKHAGIAAALAGISLLAAILLWVTRPGLDAIEDRVAAAVAEAEGRAAPGSTDSANPSLAAEGALICTLVPERSRVTSARTDDVAFEWTADGCVNGRTQYGLGQGGEWQRVFAAQDDAAVAVNTYDPETRTLRTDRYLLGQTALSAAREARAAYTPPSCGVSDGARTLGEQQSALIAGLPDRPNERLVYSCSARVDAR